MEPAEIPIGNAVRLEEATVLVRDGEFLDQDFAFDEGAGTATLTLRVLDRDLTRYEPRRLWLARRVIPHRKLKLVFRRIEQATLLHDKTAGRGLHAVGGIDWRDQRILIQTYDAVTISMRASTLDGSLHITNEVDWPA
jgi:hypothetical protein